MSEHWLVSGEDKTLYDERRVLWDNLAALLPPLPESSSDSELSESEGNTARKPYLKSTVNYENKTLDSEGNCE